MITLYCIWCSYQFLDGISLYDAWNRFVEMYQKPQVYRRLCKPALQCLRIRCFASMQETPINTRHVIEICLNIFSNISSLYCNTKVMIWYGDSSSSRCNASLYRWMWQPCCLIYSCPSLAYLITAFLLKHKQPHILYGRYCAWTWPKTEGLNCMIYPS